MCFFSWSVGGGLSVCLFGLVGLFALPQRSFLGHDLGFNFS